MKLLAALLLTLVVLSALAQPGPQGKHGFQRPMPAPERHLGREERQRLRDQVRNGQMSRDEARHHWREERARRAQEPGRSPEERQQMRRDIMEANRDIEKR